MRKFEFRAHKFRFHRIFYSLAKKLTRIVHYSHTNVFTIWQKSEAAKTTKKTQFSQAARKLTLRRPAGAFVPGRWRGLEYRFAFLALNFNFFLSLPLRGIADVFIFVRRRETAARDSCLKYEASRSVNISPTFVYDFDPKYIIVKIYSHTPWWNDDTGKVKKKNGTKTRSAFHI